MKNLVIKVEATCLIVVENTAANISNPNINYGTSLYKEILQKDDTVVIDISDSNFISAYQFVCENRNVAASVLKQIKADIKNPLKYYFNNKENLDYTYFAVVNPAAENVSITVSSGYGHSGINFICRKPLWLKSYNTRLAEIESKVDKEIEYAQSVNRNYGIIS